MKRIVLSFFALSLLAACSGTSPTTQTSAKSDGIVTFKIVQINDVYEIDPLKDGEYGGMARVAHIRDSIKKENPNTFLMLAGDFLNPSLLSTIKLDGERIQGKQMVEVMNAMDFDLVTFGNHEFDLSEKHLQERLNESNFEWTSANTRHVTKDGTDFFYSHRPSGKVAVTDYSVFEVKDADGDKIKFGVVGVTLGSNPKDYVHYGDIYKEMERAYKLAGKESDFVIGLTHVALDADQEIARRLPGLSLIMGGHEHNNMYVKEGSTMIAKADANAKTLFVHTFTYNTRNKDLHLDSQLMEVNRKIASSPEVEVVVDKWMKVLNDNLSEIVSNPEEIIFTTKEVWDGTDDGNRGKQTNLGEIITNAMINVYKGETNAAILNGGGIRIDDDLEGNISSKDIFRILLFGGQVYKVDLKGKLLSEVLDYGREKRGTGAYLQRNNLSQNPEGKWMMGGKEIAGDQVYTIAINDFLLLGLDIPFLTADHKDVIKVHKPKEGEPGYDIRTAVIDYLKSIRR